MCIMRVFIRTTLDVGEFQSGVKVYHFSKNYI